MKKNVHNHHDIALMHRDDLRTSTSDDDEDHHHNDEEDSSMMKMKMKVFERKFFIFEMNL